MIKNLKNNKTFYLVLEIVSLIIISIGSTFAYFSASKTNTGTAISGTTNTISTSALTLTTARVNLSPSPAPASDNLVPADFGVTPANMTTTTVNRALTAKCVNAGYTGCHVWKITAKCTQTVTSANIWLNLDITSVTDKNDWAYVVYTGSDTSASTIVSKGTIISSFPSDIATIDINSGAGLTANTNKVYYVMVYLNNANSAQNDGVTSGTTNATGAYNGTVTLSVMDGEISTNLHDILPSGYTRLSYIQNSGSQYIDTGVVPTENFSYYIKYKDVSASGSNYVMASRNGTSGTIYEGVSGASASKNIFVPQHSTTTPNNYRKANSIYEIRTTYNSSKTGTSSIRCTTTGETFTGTQTASSSGATANLLVFAATSTQKHTGMALYRLKLYSNGSLIRDFIPCSQDSDSAKGLCDTVNDVFYPNVGTGTFTGA